MSPTGEPAGEFGSSRESRVGFRIEARLGARGPASASCFRDSHHSGQGSAQYSHCALVKQGAALCSPRHILQLIGQSVPKRQRSEALMALDRGVGS